MLCSGENRLGGYDLSGDHFVYQIFAVVFSQFSAMSDVLTHFA